MLWKDQLPWIGALALVWLLNLGAADFLSPYIFSIVMYAGVNMVLAVSLNLINGITGQFSMGHAGFMAVGGYISALLTLWIQVTSPALLENPTTAGLIFQGALLLGGFASAAAGYLVGLPSLRLRGDYLAIVTLGFGEIIRVVLLNWQYAGGARGLPAIPGLSTFGWVFSWLVFAVFVTWRLVHSSHGRGFLSVREDEIAAEAMGVPTTQAKVRAFVLGAFFAGIAGGLFAHFLRYLNPAIFDFNRSFEIIIMVVMGGMGSISGALIAALLLTVLREALRPLQQITGIDLRMVIYALMLIGLMLTRPNGLFGKKEITDFLPKGGSA